MMRTPSDDRPRPRRRVLNTRLLGITLIAIAVIGAAAYLWRGYQVRQTAGALLKRAEDLRQEGEYVQAADYLSRYVRMRPKDAKAQVLLAETLDQATADSREKSRVVELYAQAMAAVEPKDRLPLRERIAELEWRMGNMTAAREEAEHVLATDADNPTAARVRALAMHGQYLLETLPTSETRQIAAAIERAGELNPKDLELAVLLASIYRDQPELLSESAAGDPEAQRAQRADAIVDAAVAANDESVEALLARHAYRRRYGLPGVEVDLLAALKKAPESDEVLLAATQFNGERALRLARVPGEAAEAQRRYEQAVRYGQQAIDQMPDNDAFYLLLADLHLAHDNPEQALDVCRQIDRQEGVPSIQLLCREAEARLALKQDAEAEAVLDRAAELLGQLDPRVPQEARRQLQLAYGLVRARWLLERGNASDVVELLEPLQLLEAGSGIAENRRQMALILLGQAYAQLGQWEDAGRLYAEAAEALPEAVSLRMTAAAAWEKAGDQPRAALERRLAQQSERFGPWILAVIERELQQQAVRPETERDWSEVDRALAVAEDAVDRGVMDEPWRVALLRLSYEQLLRDEPQRDRKELFARLDAIQQRYPDSAALFRHLVRLYAQLGADDRADRALAILKEKEVEAMPTVLTEARLQAFRGHYAQAEATLRAALQEREEPSVEALRELVQLHLQQGHLAEAHEILLQLQALEPTDTGVLSRLIDLAMEMARRQEASIQDTATGESAATTDWIAQAEQWLEQLGQLEGDQGHLWPYHRARLLMAEASGPDDPRWNEAVALLEQVVDRQPGWVPGLVMRADLLRRADQPEKAVEAYRTAMAAGARDVAVYEPLAMLLFRLGRYDELDELLEQLSERRQQSDRLASLEMARAGMRGEQDTLLQLAQQALDADPEDVDARLRLGWVTLATGDGPATALEQFQKAIEVADDPEQKARAYQASLVFYLRTDQTDEARALVERVLADEQLPEKQRALIAASAFQGLGEADKAASQFARAAELSPEDPTVALLQARFLLRTDFNQNADQAEEILRRVLATHPEHDTARRMLASLLAQRGGEQQWEEAERLLQQSGPDQAAANDRRLQALLLARRGGADDRTRARQILRRQIDQADTPAPGDRLLLAQLMLRDGQVIAAGEQYRTLAERDDATPEHIARYVQFLLSQDQPDEAEPWIERLEQRAAGQWATIVLRARWLEAQGRGEEIEPLIAPLASKRIEAAEDPQRQAAIAAQVGQLYAQLGRTNEALEWYGRAVESKAPTSETLARYVDLLLTAERLDEADAQLNRLERIADGELPTVALRARWLEASEQPEKVEPLIEQAAKGWTEPLHDQPQAQARLALLVGRLYGKLQRPVAARRWYDRLRELAPSQYAPLAMALARQNQLDDAIQLCLEAAEAGDSVQPARVLTAVLLEGNPTEEQLQRAEPLLRRAIDQHADDLWLQTAIAALWVDQDRPTEAIALYKRILEQDPEHVLTLNNLATCLGEQEDQIDQALRYIDRAIELAGPQPMLLDTKGTILVRRDQIDQAVELLEQATASTDSDPRYWLHLADAYHRQGQMDKARAALRRAEDGELHRYVLSGFDVKLFEQLQETLTSDDRSNP